MRDHLLILPVVLPLVTAIVLLFAARRSTWLHRGIGLGSTALLVGISLWLVAIAGDGGHEVYVLGDWSPPFGIVLVLDRLSAAMMAVMSVLALFSLLYASGGEDRGPYFPALFQFQLMGLSGAFLTGDLFNLFVFFEVLLIASYSLLMNSGGLARSRAGFHYVVLNLVGSLLFLLGAGILYGASGTLNMADLAVQVSQATPANQALLAAGGLVLLVVFGLKAALLPLLFWLPRTYSAASPAVAALFAVMTKVGVYAMLRTFPLVYGPLAGDLEGLVWDWLWPLSLATMVLALIGTLGAQTLSTLVSWQIVLSMGTLMTIMSLGQAHAYGALIFYLIHTTWITGGLFLVAGLVKSQRGTAGDVLSAAPKMQSSTAISVLFLIGAMGVAGLPPMSGFPAKLALLQSTGLSDGWTWIWALVVGGGLISLIALSRAATHLFWGHSEGQFNEKRKLHPCCYIGAMALVLASPLLSLGAQPALDFTRAAGEQLAAPQFYIDAVLGRESVSALPAPVEGRVP
ncbi:monovalent cation/H+ antiporter subunit D [Hydrocarboniclastica marina]|uniref:Monovalent cation/H+ antiporter subunit D n=1 Tax=Hydrocarboniclastica marina TaxID=2259620 RepID=A0A4P7XL70_9ALTE|nr:monovalent cation/H+ antiporter subunit D [Hydrocarboniclastica marina]QCF26697.1 monovalent cation/H+ antiporter subunit D [Hydrocarboniclastica marina]